MDSFLIFGIGMILGMIIMLYIRVMKFPSKGIEEMDYIPGISSRPGERLRFSSEKEVLFAEPVAPDDAFKTSKDVDDFISKLKPNHE